MQQTERLYEQDAYLDQFEAQVVEAGADDGRPYVILNRTAFYPEGGGQPADMGLLGNQQVEYVSRHDEWVYHWLDRPFSGSSGQVVRGQVDWRRRFDHMQHHSGQHILSAVCEDIAGARTSSFHLASGDVTIDLDRQLTPQQLKRIEERANQLIAANLPVEVHTLTADEFQQRPDLQRQLRGQLDRHQEGHATWRLVAMGDFDLSPCGGTHLERTAEAGLLRITSYNIVGDGCRVGFRCGHRLLEYVRELDQTTAELKNLLSTGANELPARVQQLLEENKQLGKDLQEARGELAAVKANALANNPSQVGPLQWYYARWQGAGMSDLQRAVGQLQEKAPGPCVITLFGAGSEDHKFVLASQDVDLNLNQLLAAVLAPKGAKGGGPPSRVQGGSLALDAGGLEAEIHTWLEENAAS